MALMIFPAFLSRQLPWGPAGMHRSLRSLGLVRTQWFGRGTAGPKPAAGTRALPEKWSVIASLSSAHVRLVASPQIQSAMCGRGPGWALHDAVVHHQSRMYLGRLGAKSRR